MSFYDKFTFKNGVELKNKLAMSPMTTYSGNKDGNVSDQELTYYSERSKEVGMIITGTTFMQENGQGFENQFYAGNDDYIPSLERLSKTIKQHGAKAILQIFHAGRMSKPGLKENQDIVSASNIPAERENAPIPRELMDEEIQEIIKSFYEVTIRAIKAGFDGVEIHGANTYLIQQFFSPHSNRRIDKWGGNTFKRLKFPLKVVDSVIQAKNDMKKDDFIIGYRFSPEERENPGITLEDTKILVDKLCEKDLDYLHISLGKYNQTSIREENNKITGKEILKVINGRVPLIGVGSIFSEEDLEKAEEIGYDLIAIGRGLLIEPKVITTLKNEKEIQKIIDKNNTTLPDNLLEKITKHQKSYGITIK